MIVKWSGLPTGQTHTATFYDASVSPEVAIAAAGGTLTEDSGLGVYRRNVGTNLDVYTIVRVRITPGNYDAWVDARGNSTQEVTHDPILLELKYEVDSLYADGLPAPANGNDSGATTDTISNFVQGDDYSSASPWNVLSWSISNAVANLTGATGKFIVQLAGSNVFTPIDIAVVDPNGAAQRVTATVTNANSALVKAGVVYDFQVALTLTSGAKYTPVKGTFTPSVKRLI